MNSSGFNLDSRRKNLLLRAKFNSLAGERAEVIEFCSEDACLAINLPLLNKKTAFP
jgi:hypothetical protein